MKSQKTIMSLLATLVVPVAWAVTPFTIEDIRVEGLERTEPATVFSYLPVKIGDTFTDIRGEEIIKTLYATGFFEDIQVETQGRNILLTVTERPVISSLKVSGGKDFSNEDIKKNLEQMGLASARVFDPVVLAMAAEGLREEYRNRGKKQVNVETKTTVLERNRVAVEVEISEGDTTVVRDIDFEGNEHFSARTLRNQMNTSESGWLTWLTHSNRFADDTFSSDLQNIVRFYRNNGYYDAAVVDTRIEPHEGNNEKLNVVITLREGQRYRWGDVTVTGDAKEIPMSELRESVKVKKGKWFSQEKLEDILQGLQQRLGNAGYATAEINVQPQPAGENMNFVLSVVPRDKIYVNTIDISGNNKTRDEVIRRELRQMESAPYDYGKIERSKERIQQLGYFESVDITSKPVEGALDQVDLSVKVKEQPTGTIDVSAGYVQDDGVVLSAGVAQDNIFGSGKSASFRVSNSSASKQASLSFTDPYFTADGVSLGYDLFWRSYDARELEISSYKTEKYGAGMHMGVPITEYDRVNFGLGVNRQTLTIDKDSPVYYRNFVEEYGNKNWTVSGNIGWGRNTTDSAFWPTRGYIIDAGLEAGLPGGDIKYYKLTHNQKWFFPITRDLTWMISAGVGYGNGYGRMKELPFFNNFTAGGLGSVRGYEGGSVGPKVNGSSLYYSDDVDYLGGNRQVLLSTELLMPFPGIKNSRTVRLSLFADAGSVWDGKHYDAGDYKYYGAKGHHSTFGNELRYSVGAAFTWVSPLGPLKFSYAYPINKKEGDQLQRFQFQLGTVF